MSETFAPQHSIGSMGSEFWRIAVSPEIVPNSPKKSIGTGTDGGCW